MLLLLRGADEWNTDNFGFDCGMLFLIGFVVRVIAYVCLELLHRDKRK